tara:strand:- start:91358 stop:92257 length:900 start_codon:yes stop_codon:yes gene_type:complete
MSNSLQEKIIHTKWALSSFYDRIKAVEFWVPTISFTAAGALAGLFGYGFIAATDATNVKPRNYTDSPASAFNLISAVKIPEALCSDLQGHTYLAAQNGSGEYVLLEQKQRGPVLPVSSTKQQGVRLNQIVECLDDNAGLSASALVEFGDEFKFSSTGGVYGPLNLYDETTEENAVVYDFNVQNFQSYADVNSKLKDVKELLGDEKLSVLTTDKLQKTWSSLARDVKSKGFAPYNADELPTASYSSATWSKAFSVMGGGAGSCFLFGAIFGFRESSGRNADKIRQKYETQLSLVGRKSIM